MDNNDRRQWLLTEWREIRERLLQRSGDQPLISVVAQLYRRLVSNGPCARVECQMEDYVRLVERILLVPTGSYAAVYESDPCVSAVTNSWFIPGNVFIEFGNWEQVLDLLEEVKRRLRDDGSARLLL